MQTLAENVCHGREIIEVPGIANRPFSFHIVFPAVRRKLVGNLKQTDFRIIAVGQFFFRAKHPGSPTAVALRAYGKLHIALSCAQPHFAYQNIFNSNYTAFTFYFQRLRAGCRGRSIQIQFPFSVNSRRRSIFRSPRCLNRDFLAGISLSEYLHIGSLLQQHIVGKNRRQLNSRRHNNR